MPGPIIVALDIPRGALRLARALAPYVGMVKVGHEGLLAEGPAGVRALVDAGLPVFLDLKAHDIPRTVAATCREARARGARMLTVHACGGPTMVGAAKEAAGDLQVIAVTVLTHLSAGEAQQISGRLPTEWALELAAMALDAGADGVVCAAHELGALRSLGGVRVVPGVRPTGAVADDQTRVATPREALAAGADWLVIGRPIVAAEDPAAAARALYQACSS
jgi:orotidine-5'-phosphate decarboxylase